MYFCGTERMIVVSACFFVALGLRCGFQDGVFFMRYLPETEGRSFCLPCSDFTVTVEKDSVHGSLLSSLLSKYRLIDCLSRSGKSSVTPHPPPAYRLFSTWIRKRGTTFKNGFSELQKNEETLPLWRARFPK